MHEESHWNVLQNFEEIKKISKLHLIKLLHQQYEHDNHSLQDKSQLT